MTELHDTFGAIVPWLQQYGYAALFVGVLLESFGLPLPGETLLIAGAALAAKGELQIAPLLGCAWLAAVLGDNIGFALGHFGGRRLILRYGGRVGITESRFGKVEAFFDRFGAEVVLIARFFAVARQLNGIVAGSVGMGWWRFLAYNAIGAALWVGAWGLGVYLFGQRLAQALPWIHRFGYLAIGLIAVAAVAAGVVLLVRRRAPGPAERE